jgi:hypothetical protein
MATKILIADPDNLETEIIAHWQKTFDFAGEQRTLENSLYRFFVYFEGLGSSLWKVTALTRRGQTVEQTLLIPAVSDTSVQVAVFDMKTTDVIQTLIFTLQCGKASIVLCAAEIEPKGQFRKDT